MSEDLIKSHLNLYAVLPNMEELVVFDSEMARLISNWNLSIQFSVRGGPSAFLVFEKGRCRWGRGKRPRPSIHLFFSSPRHCNRMFDGKANPIPIRGFTRLGFLTREFVRLTDRLETYLKPDDQSLQDSAYLELNTRMTLNTAAFAVRELALLDPIGKLAASHIRDGVILMKILPDGPAVSLEFRGGTIDVRKEEADRPMALMMIKNAEVANRFLNGRIDPFTAVASGDVMIKGQTPMLDSVSLILDRIPGYLN